MTRFPSSWSVGLAGAGDRAKALAKGFSCIHPTPSSLSSCVYGLEAKDCMAKSSCKKDITMSRGCVAAFSTAQADLALRGM